MSIKEMVKDNKKVEFVRYQNSELWYRADNGFEFPVPISDAGSASFAASDKAILFMRWMKRHLDNIEAGKNSELAVV